VGVVHSPQCDVTFCAMLATFGLSTSKSTASAKYMLCQQICAVSIKLHFIEALLQYYYIYTNIA